MAEPSERDAPERTVEGPPEGPATLRPDAENPEDTFPAVDLWWLQKALCTTRCYLVSRPSATTFSAAGERGGAYTVELDGRMGATCSCNDYTCRHATVVAWGKRHFDDTGTLSLFEFPYPFPRTPAILGGALRFTSLFSNMVWVMQRPQPCHGKCHDQTKTVRYASGRSRMSCSRRGAVTLAAERWCTVSAWPSGCVITMVMQSISTAAVAGTKSQPALVTRLKFYLLYL